MAPERTPLAELLLERIRASGPLTFAEFMESCLYHPEHGYYSRPEARRFADYYTSPDVHPVFGRLLARQLAEMWERLGRPRRSWISQNARCRIFSPRFTTSPWRPEPHAARRTRRRSRGISNQHEPNRAPAFPNAFRPAAFSQTSCSTRCPSIA